MNSRKVLHNLQYSNGKKRKVFEVFNIHHTSIVSWRQCGKNRKSLTFSLAVVWTKEGIVIIFLKIFLL